MINKMYWNNYNSILIIYFIIGLKHYLFSVFLPTSNIELQLIQTSQNTSSIEVVIKNQHTSFPSSTAAKDTAILIWVVPERAHPGVPRYQVCSVHLGHVDL